MIGLAELVVLGLALVAGGVLLLVLPALLPAPAPAPARRARHRAVRRARHRPTAGAVTVRQLRRRLYAEALRYRQAW
ncbi:MAG TPA: hypothetical protein VIL00_10180 [Pseudonocardiaceae bacterium]